EEFAFGNDGTEAGDGAFDKVSVSVDFHSIAAGAHFEAHGDGGGFVDVEGDALLQIGLEAAALDLQLIVADGEIEQEINAGVIRCRGAGPAGFGLLGDDGGAIHDGSAGIGDGAADTACDLL